MHAGSAHPKWAAEKMWLKDRVGYIAVPAYKSSLAEAIGCLKHTASLFMKQANVVAKFQNWQNSALSSTFEMRQIDSLATNMSLLLPAADPISTNKERAISALRCEVLCMQLIEVTTNTQYAARNFLSGGLSNVYVKQI
eukprot:1158732-Pelagomonas_calceolata.AAC.3